MTRITVGGYGHSCRHRRIESFGIDDYIISWCYDTKHGRIRFSNRISRETDKAGAKRFCKKWNIPFPKENG